MYKVEFYEDKNGNSEIADYFYDIAQKSKTDKDARINKNKIFAYVKALEEYGTRIGSPVVKHIEGNLWELRMISGNPRLFNCRDESV